MYYPATFTPHENNSGRYDVTFVDLPGCVSQGENMEDALRMAQEALTLHLSGMLEDGDSLPAPSTLEQAQAKDEQLAQEENIPLAQGTLRQYVLAAPKAKGKEDPKVPVSVSMKESLIARLDETADELGINRSAIITLATREYLNRMQG